MITFQAKTQPSSFYSGSNIASKSWCSILSKEKKWDKVHVIFFLWSNIESLIFNRISSTNLLAIFCLLNSTIRDEKTKDQTQSLHLAFISIAGKWFAENQLAIPTLPVNIGLGNFYRFNLSSVPIFGDN